jgi:hypothetical protein
MAKRNFRFFPKQFRTPPNTNGQVQGPIAGSLEELIAMVNLPLIYHSTVQFALRDFELPFSADDFDFFNDQTVINLFALNQLVPNQKIQYGPNMSSPTFTVDTPMAVTGFCVFTYGEPARGLVEGNQFGPQTAITHDPASPINLRADAASLAALVANGAGATWASPAHLEIGSPTWRFLWAWLQSHLMVLQCPHSAFDTVMRERLVDIGNCCSLMDYTGFGDAQASHLYWTRRVNERLTDIMHGAQEGGLPDEDRYGTPAGTDPGYFFPINSEQNGDTEISPNRTTGQDESYGTPRAYPAVETWFRLPYPMFLFDDTKIKLTFERDGDAVGARYFQRMLDEACLKLRQGPVPALDSLGAAGQTFPLSEPGEAPQVAGGHADFTQLPAGQMRLGLGMKGFYLRPQICGKIKDELKNIDAASFGKCVANGGTCGFPRKGNIETVEAGDLGEPRDR